MTHEKSELCEIIKMWLEERGHPTYWSRVTVTEEYVYSIVAFNGSSTAMVLFLVSDGVYAKIEQKWTKNDGTLNEFQIARLDLPSPSDPTFFPIIQVAIDEATELVHGHDANKSAARD